MKAKKTQMQTSVIKKTLLLALMLVTGSVWAEWVKMGESASDKFYIDLATIRKDGNLRKVWAITDFKQQDKSGALSNRIRFEYDCKEERSRLLSMSTHSEPLAKGTPLVQINEAGPWSDIAPGTVHETFLKAVCAK